MRPRRLRFSGLRSYRSEADINFTDLDLFAVIGDTGAGKSTIIEALCLALYGKKTWSGDSLKDVIADGEDIMRVEFTFDADGHTWVVRRARRRRAGPGQDLLQSTTNHMPDVNGHGPVTQRVVDLLGLTFDQFTRAVVMPQGRFDELLRSTPGPRNQILKSLLGLESMTLAAKAAVEARDQVRPIHDRYLERRRAFPPDPTMELRTATAARDAAANRRSLLERSVGAVKGPLVTQQVTARLHGPLTGSLSSLGPEPDDAVEVLTACHEIGERLQTDLATVKDTLAEAKVALDSASQQIEVALGGFTTREHLAAAASRVADAAQSLPDDLAALAEAHTKWTGLNEARPATTIDPALLESETEANRDLVDLRDSHGRAKDAHADAKAAWIHLVAARDQLPAAMAAASGAKDAHETAAAAVTDAKARLAATEEGSRTATEAFETVRFANSVAAVAAGHVPGDPCPVCDRALSPDFEAPVSADLDAAAARLASAEDLRTAVAVEFQAARERASELAASARLLGDSAAEAREGLEVSEAHAKAAGVDVTADHEDQALAKVGAAVTEASGRLRQSEAKAQAASLARTTAELALAAERSRHADQVAAAQAEVVGAQKRLERYVTMIEALPADWKHNSALTLEGLTPGQLDDLGRRLHSATEVVSAAAKRMADAEASVATAERNRESIRANAGEQVTQPAMAALGRVNSYLAQVRRVASGAQSAADECDLDVEVPGGATQDVPTDVSTADLPSTIATASERLRNAAGAIAFARRVVAEIAAAQRAAATSIERALADACCQTVDQLHDELGQARIQEEQAEVSVAAAGAAVLKVAAVNEVLDLASPLRDDLEVLCAALGNNQFVDHLLDLREAELLAEASRRLKALTGDKFAFIADFGIKNTASGETRSPDALSGGERFQASLALALALVEIASRGAGRLDAVFVDEGFGSLDQNALETALATLGRIAGGGKTVALISHLRAVAEYVDTVMHVTRDDVFGSKIRTLTEEERDHLLSDDIRSGLTT